MRSSSTRSALAAVALATLGTSPLAAAESTWNYNGSSVLLVEDGGSVTVTYIEPRPMLKKENVKQGTVLLKASLDGSTLKGTSYVFRGGCDPAPYEVTGRYVSGGSQRTLELEGVVPRRAVDSCALITPPFARPSRLLFTRTNNGVGREPSRGLPDDGSLVVREQACSGYSNPAEREICLDRDLGRLDADIAALYDRATKSLDADAARLKAEQQAWIKERDACGTDSRCLSAALKARRGALEKWVK
jgi:uncharacterized protein YecT (DUF1311 family)